MTGIAENLRTIKSGLPAGVKLVVVSKHQSPEAVMEAYETGHRLFGENKAQELLSKAPLLPDDIEWHFIGHLQRNKVKAIVPHVRMIHSVDSIKLLKEINKESEKIGQQTQCLLQFHIAKEESKYGMLPEKADLLLQQIMQLNLSAVLIRGVMGMATFTDNQEQVSMEFNKLATLFGDLKYKHFQGDHQFTEISMGMSDDYLLAIPYGATLLRIGSRIFGT
jgi:PLP dependent protein